MEEEVYHHLSHDHPLHLVKPPTKTPRNIICSCCKLTVLPRTLDFYTCKTCDFSLHRSCFQFPHKIQHPSHPNHALSIVTTPSSSICRACGEQVNGFHYHCAVCSTSYHVLCSCLPQFVSVTSHPHPLKLEFLLPYDFCCDICQKPGLNTMWLYRCELCEFDTHLNCAFLRSRSSKSAPAGGGEEIMQLTSQKMENRVLARRSSFPEENLHIEGGRVCMTDPESHDHTKPDTIDDKSGLISIDLTPTQSCQFSGSYFSIDLSKSYPSLTPIGNTKQDKDQENKKVGPNKAKLVDINEDVFLDWGEPQSKKNLIEMDRRLSKNITKGSSFTSSGSAKPETWKKLFCCV